MSSRFQFVEDHRGAFGVKRLCRILAVSRSGFYRWRAGASARAGGTRADAELAEDIDRIHQESDGTYGVPRVTAELKEAGRPVNHKRVERVMRTFHIVALHLYKKVRTPIPEPSATPVPDLLQRDIAAQEPNTRHVGDITYLEAAGAQVEQAVHAGTDPGAGGGDLRELDRTDLVHGAVQRGDGGRMPRHQRGVPHHIDPGDRARPEQYRARCTHQHPGPVVDRMEVPAHQRRRQRVGQPGFVRQPAHRHDPRLAHQLPPTRRQ
ncbi:IS3 family transposase [Streptomyces sp. NPDC058086]|uniref:IS3 family transposase n=1 Tax=Streptomyces sp. NPDC058086 TaxID=3346334 RepID=UPI0036E4FAFF